MTAIDPGVPRSGFVTAVAWIFIVLASLATLIAVLQNLMVAAFFFAGFLDEAANGAAQDSRLPPFAAAMFRYLPLLVLLSLALSGGMLTAAIGLLKRRDWGRKMFIALLSIAILFNVLAVIVSIALVWWIPTPTGANAQEFRIFMGVMIVFKVLMEVGLSVLFGWIVKRLLSPAVRREFA